MAQPNTEYKMYSFLTNGYAQHHESEHITDTGNKNHISTVIQLNIAIAILCLCSDFSTLLDSPILC